MLRQILEKLANLMLEDKLKLKADKQRKAKQAVDEILKSESLATMREKCVEIVEGKKQLLASAEMAEATTELNILQHQTETLKLRKSNIETDECIKENQRQELLVRIRTLKNAIETNVHSFMGKQIQIQ